MSPNDIEVLLHYHCSHSVHPRIDAPAVQGAIRQFVDARLLIQLSGGPSADVYETTEGGKMLVEQLCAVPFPVLKWVAGDVEPKVTRGMTWFMPSSSDFNSKNE